jgi:hypothetical protein
VGEKKNFSTCARVFKGLLLAWEFFIGDGAFIDFEIGLGPRIKDPLPIESDDVFLLFTISELSSNDAPVFYFLT